MTTKEEAEAEIAKRLAIAEHIISTVTHLCGLLSKGLTVEDLTTLAAGRLAIDKMACLPIDEWPMDELIRHPLTLRKMPKRTGPPSVITSQIPHREAKPFTFPANRIRTRKK